MPWRLVLALMAVMTLFRSSSLVMPVTTQVDLGISERSHSEHGKNGEKNKTAKRHFEQMCRMMYSHEI